MLAVSHCPDWTYGELQPPLSFGASLGLNGNKVIFNAVIYRGSLGGLLSPESHVFRVACSQPITAGPSYPSAAVVGMSCLLVAARLPMFLMTYPTEKLDGNAMLEPSNAASTPP